MFVYYLRVVLSQTFRSGFYGSYDLAQFLFLLNLLLILILAFLKVLIYSLESFRVYGIVWRLLFWI